MQNMAEGLTFLPCAAPQNSPPQAQLAKGFLKPGSDDEDSAHTWKKSVRAVQEVDSVKNQQEKEMVPEESQTSHQGGAKAAVTLERCNHLTSFYLT